MVINGTTIQENGLKVVNIEGVRVRLPPYFAKEAGLTGTTPMQCVLLVLAAGRYRLAAKSADVSKVSQLLQESETDGDALRSDSNGQAAAGARLIPCVASPHGRGWRINLPKEAIHLAPGADRSHVFLTIVQGFIELWFPETLRQAVSVPISEILP